MPQTLIPSAILDEDGIEHLVVQSSSLGRDAGTLNIDLGRVESIDPYGMVGLLMLGRHFSERGHKLLLHLPLSMEVQRCLDRMGFFRYLSEFYIMYPPYRPLAARASPAGREVGPSRSSDVLLEITRVAQSDDVNKTIDAVKGRTGDLEPHLRYKEEATRAFLAALDRILQNIVDHSQTTGLVAIRKYIKKNDKNTVKVAVMDLGTGFKGSLSVRLGPRYGRQWSDMAALEEAALNGVSGRPEAGRGRGLATVINFAQQWGVQLSIRTGTAKLAFLPEDIIRRETGLPEFPGVRISLVLYEV
jgi:hypothetical protein